MMNMNAGLKKLAVMLTITAILLSFTQANMKMVSSSDTGRKIDVFTQKIPFNGKGINQSSDAFEPQELVILYANVTYNEAPVANKLVAFQVNNPANAFQNITLVGFSSTNQSGIAQFSFRIPWPPENAEQIVFGEWSAIATVDIAGQVVVDTLTFQVGWIIKITKITTLNAKFEPQTKFLRGDVIVFDLTVENIALTLKSATIMIDAQDAGSYPIIHIEMDNLVFQPGENHVRAYSQIPTAAAIGEATVSAAAYTAPPKISGVLYSPAILSTFEITRVPVPVEKHDIAVLTVSPSKTLVYTGEIINIYVVVKNEGTYIESFNATAFYDSTVVGTLFVNSLHPEDEKLLVFYWNTQNVTEGNYTLSAEANVVPGEANIDNNRFVDGVVWVKPWVFPPVWKIPIWLLALLFLLAMLIGILLLLVLMCALLRRRRRKKKDKMVIPPIPSTLMPFQRSKKCRVCGKEFLGVYTFCPYCFTFHGKDYK
jgi:hypothetical protein